MKPILLFFVSFFSTSVFAATTITGVSNLSYWDDTNKVIYGGVAGTCAGSATTTCDSCMTATTLEPCNQKRISGALQLTIRFKTSVDLTGVTKAVGLGTDVGGTKQLIAIASANAIGQAASTEYTLSVPWSQLCQSWAGSIFDSNCEAQSGTEAYGSAKSLYVYVNEDKDSDLEDSESGSGISLAIHSIAAGTPPSYSSQDYCSTGANSGTNFGLCFYSLVPGDEKLVVQDSPGTKATTNLPVSTPGYYGAAFFALPTTLGGETATITSFIPNQTTPKVILFKSASDLTLTQSYITDLANDQPYCVIGAQVNLAQNVFGFTTGTADTSQMCGTPSEVVGLLDDKHCFISTAAFGSDMAHEVVLFREFRNKVLAPSKFGAKLIHAYYIYSPPIADFISQSEILRSLTRGLLYPLLGFSWLALHMGILPATFFALLTLITAFHLRRRLGQVFSRPRGAYSSKGRR